MSLPRIAIVGRPNVGKSSLLNMLARERVSIVDPTPGVTRDRVAAVIELTGPLKTERPKMVEIIDTGGFGVYTAEGAQFNEIGEDLSRLSGAIEAQIEHAVQTSDLILFVIDAQLGVTALDETFAQVLREKADKVSTRVVMVANKVDAENWEPYAAEASALGFGEPMMWLNLLSTAAGFIFAFGVIAFLVSIGLAWRHGRRAEPNPWRASTLEWALPTPPPTYNFVSVPSVAGRDPLWDDPEWAARQRGAEGFLRGAPRGRRELLGTSMRDATPELVIVVSGSTWMPLVTALVMFAALVAFILKAYLVCGALVLAIVACVIAWLWTTGDALVPGEVDADGDGAQRQTLPTQAGSPDAPGLWGTAVFLLVSGALLASLVFAYYYLWLGADAWPPPGHSVPSVAWLAGAVGAALAASAALHWLRAPAVAGALLAVVLACEAVALAAFDGAPREHAYAAVVCVLIGFHAVHVAIAALMCGFTVLKPLALRITALFTHYTVAAGVLIAAVVALFPEVQ